MPRGGGQCAQTVESAEGWALLIFRAVADARLVLRPVQWVAVRLVPHTLRGS
jgi:hypothetical protein